MKNRSSNTVAVIMWVYAIVNAVVGIIFACSMYDTYEVLSILFIAVTVVFSFGIYAVGEIPMVRFNLSHYRKSRAAR